MGRRRPEDPQPRRPDREPDAAEKSERATEPGSGALPGQQPLSHIENPSGVMPMGVDVTLDLSGNPTFKPNANTGGPGSAANIGNRSENASALQPSTPPDAPEATMITDATDPVCGMAVDKANAAATSEYQGQPYYFCATACRDEFERNPARYVDPHRAAS